VEPVTHILTGVCLARTGPNRTAAYATATMAIAAELPDIDTVWGLRGPVDAFQHHRGITHTLVGVPVEAALLVGAVWAWHKAGIRDKGTGIREKDGPSVRWGVLYLWAVVALLSHLLLDYTNNYGLRPFFPFDGRWYAASIVFIVDPLILVLLTGALVMPALLGLVGAEVGARRPRFRGRGWAVAALVGMVGWWSIRAVEHSRAMQLAQSQSIAAPEDTRLAVQLAPFGTAPPEDTPVYLTAQRTLASPDPLSPFRWSTVTDFGPVYQQAEVNSRLNALQPSDVLTSKPVWDTAERRAAASPLGRAYLDWSPMPFLEEMPTPDGGSLITFRDPRFLGGWLGSHDRSPLTGTVTLDSSGRLVEQTMDGRVQR
jgi:inner membrane protein